MTTSERDAPAEKAIDVAREPDAEQTPGFINLRMEIHHIERAWRLLQAAAEEVEPR